MLWKLQVKDEEGLRRQQALPNLTLLTKSFTVEDTIEIR